MTHPNTVAAAIAGGIGTLTVYLLNKYVGTHLTSVHAGLIATAASAVLLFVGRRGIKGAVTGVWDGVWNGTPKPAAAPSDPGV